MEVAEPRSKVTQLLVASSGGDAEARDQMLPLVYDELRRIAASYLRRERPDHTLQPTALVHEAYLRLIDQRSVDWRNRAQFLGVAAQMMRRVLSNYARGRGAAKRGDSRRRVSLSLAENLTDRPEIDAFVLSDALDRLATLDERKARTVELKVFGGLTTVEISEVVGVSAATVERDWTFARAWLVKTLSNPGASSAQSGS